MTMTETQVAAYDNVQHMLSQTRYMTALGWATKAITVVGEYMIVIFEKDKE